MIAQGIIILICLEVKMKLLKCLNITRIKLKINLEKIKVVKSDRGGEYEATFDEFYS